MVDFSVVICTFNGANRLPQVLEDLKRQQVIQSLDWEVIVVDNNSCDRTPEIVQTYQQTWLPLVPLRYCFEPRQGIAYARRCALDHSTAPLVGFLDDDTQPSPTWVQAAYDFGQSHPQAGAYGSAIQAQTEVPLPPQFERIAPLLAIIDRGPHPFAYQGRHSVLPAGAGMVVRRQAWDACVPTHPHLRGVNGTSLAQKGEDVETLSYIRDGGWQVWHNPAMAIAHHLPAHRLQRPYLANLGRAIGLSRWPLRRLRHRPWQRSWVCLAYGLNDLRRLVVYGLCHGLPLVQGDAVCACEWSLRLYSLLSPLYDLWQTLTPAMPTAQLPSPTPYGWSPPSPPPYPVES
ncbi:MAG: hormogonium polysaccharide biosynthesis glycosyltransferase HpsE [Leptolyngbya sp.]|nr:hormogonium polysaccharide biosynthesis glycosyltransferase HpsE [Leptolyngbya sp.]